jgi:predicted PurR-regulated permease PerM
VTETASTVPAKKSTGERALDGPISTKPLLSKRARVTTTIVSVIVLLVIVAALVGLGYLGYTSYDRAGDGVPGTVRLRDMSFIVLAVETLVIMILILIITVLLAVIIIVVYDRVIPILEEINRAISEGADAVQTVRGTTTFISEKMVNPVIEVSSYASGVRRILKGILDLWPRRK